MPTLEQLRQRHPSLDTFEVGDIRALYNGGKDFEKRITRLLPQRPAEVSSRYEIRSREAHYRNYVGPCIDYFTAMLFSSRPATVAKSDGEEVVEPGEYYDKLRDDCDRNGANLDVVFKGLLTEAMIAHHAWLRVHSPPIDGQALENLKAFEDAKAGDCWLEALPHEAVLDWECDESGRLEWVLLHRVTSKRPGVSGTRKEINETWDFVTVDRVVTYAITYDKSKPPSATDEIPQIGDTPHRFGRVPVVCMELPIGLWVGNRLKSPQLAHFRLSNAQTWGMATACYAMPVFKLTEDAEGNFRMPTMGAGYGIFIGKDDDFSWAAPPATPFAALGEEVKAHKDEIFRIAQQMAIGVDNNAAAVGRSGESKKADTEATRVVLLAYSRVVKEAIEYTYDLISAVRGDKFEWSIEGLDDFAALDVGGLAETLAQIKDVGGIPSKTWNVAVKSRLAEAILPDLDQATKATIRKEIEEGEPEPGEELAAEVDRLHALSAGLTGSDAGAQSGMPGKPNGASAAQGKRPAHDPSGALPIIERGLQTLSGHPVRVTMGEGKDVPLPASHESDGM